MDSARRKESAPASAERLVSMVVNGPPHRPGRVAKNAARKVHEYFARHWQQIQKTSRATPASLASTEAIEAVIDAAFRVSLRREEGYIPRLSLAILAPEEAIQPLVFEEALRLTPVSLARLSPAVARSGLQVAVWHIGDELRAWGTVRSIPMACCAIEVAAPGLLVVKHGPSERPRQFVNVAILEGDQIRMVGDPASATIDCSALVNAVLGSAPGLDSADVLQKLAVSMRAHGHGGTLLVVPGDSEMWRESVVHPMQYAVRPRFSTLAELARGPGKWRRREWETELSAAVEVIAGLTAVDGATVITNQYELIAFGAKTAPRPGYLRVEQVSVTESIEGGLSMVVHPTHLGGTRHFSAVQFVSEQRNALALVASQDGRFTVFSWSPSDVMVRAHRVEALLM